MPRPLTQRLILSDLHASTFHPDTAAEDRKTPAKLTLDGLEALRLADLEGLYQQEAARRMGVSRATFARILSAARRAVSDALVNRKVLSIDGGVVDRRPSESWPCPIHGGRQRRGRGCRCEEAEGPGRSVRHRARRDGEGRHQD